MVLNRGGGAIGFVILVRYRKGVLINNTCLLAGIEVGVRCSTLYQGGKLSIYIDAYYSPSLTKALLATLIPFR